MDSEAEKQHASGNTSIPINHHKQGEFGFNSKTTFTNPLFIDPNNPAQMEELKIEGSKHPGLVEAHEIRAKLIEKRLQAVEGRESFNKFDAKELCLVPDLIIPPKFKMPNFEKFDGASCPKEHITMYCRMMTGYGDNEKLLIHCFQDSLKGSARRWYNRLSRYDVRLWRQLAQAFMQQYKYLSNMAPDRLALQNMEMKPFESFREYAQRWLGLASQVQPPLTGKERSTLFVSTLPKPYYEKMIASSTKDFADILVSGEMIENAIKNGKINAGCIESGSDDEETLIDDTSQQEYSAYVQDPPVHSTILHLPFNPSSTSGFIIQHKGQPKSRSNNKAKGKRDRNRVFSIPMPYTELLPQLIENHLLMPVQSGPVQSPYPSWYDPDASCDYHSGTPGHSVENCPALKYKVRDLMKAGTLTFSDDGESIFMGHP